MTATDELRKLLDERGIACEKRRGYIRWSKQTEYGVTHYQAWPCSDGTVTLTVRDEYGLTPEQAIAATLGGGKLTVEQVRGAIEANSWAETSTIREFNDSSWQAIADELNAAMGGECENVAPDYLDFLCSVCGFVHYHSDENDTGDGNDWAYCPRCGKAVKR